MKTIVVKVAQFILGLFMAVIGLNKFHVFIEIPNPPGDGGELMRIYIASGFLKMVGILEMVGGLTLVLNKFVPIGLTLITAIMFNATAFHLLYDPPGAGPALLSSLLSLTLIYIYKHRFKDYWN